MKKRILCFVLVFVMTLGFLPTLSVANALAFGDLTYEIHDGEVTITGCNESVTSVTIPSEIEGYPVTAIGYEAFYSCDLESITIPNSVTSIGNNAFYWCSDLESITIPDSVASIGDGAFSSCYSLAEIFVGENNLNFTASGGVLYNKSKTELVCYPNGKSSSFIIPDGVTTIGNYAFSYCSKLASISIPDSVTTIGDWAFSFCTALSNITIPDSVTTIGEQAFISCDALTSVIIPDSITTIGDSLFYDCSNLESITIPDNVTSIGNYSFYRCAKLKTITVPDGVTIIGNRAFSSCSALESISIPDSVTSIGDWVLSHCPELKSIIIPDSVTTIGSYAFYDCSSLTSITIPDSVNLIGKDAFFGTAYLNDEQNWKDEVLYIGKHLIKAKENISGEYNIKPDTITIAGNAFYRCESLESIIIPDSVTSIGESIFFGCSNLKSIIVDENNKYYSSQDDILFNKDNTVLYAYAHSKDNTEYLIPYGVTTISRDAFYNCKNLVSITIPNSVTSIGYSAFASCTNLKNITIPDSVTSIGMYTFSGCNTLTSITIPDSVTSIGRDAFYYCSSLTSITIGDSVTSIGSGAFYCCSSLSSITIPDSVTSIGGSAFYCCSSLSTITISDSVKSIFSAAFYKCTSLKNINYKGSKSDRESISIGTENDYLLNATWTYNYHEHTYDNACDTACNVCGEVRTITHTYGEYASDNNATTEKDGTKTRVCTVCGAKDTVTDVGSKLPTPEPKPEEKPEEKPAVEIKDTTKIFTDVKAKKWYTNAVNYAYSHGFIAGVSDTEFGRDVPVTRGMFITILARIAGVDTSSKANKVTTKFTDVKSGKYYTNAIKWASENGVVNGLTDTTFGPNNAIERQQLCTMIVNFAKYMKIDLKASQQEIKFADAGSIRKYAKNAVATCQKAGVVSGYAVDGGTEFKPLNTATRAEAAQILYKFHKDFVA